MRTRLDQQKRQHHERGQLKGRERLGLLEKHKDYVKRAKDYHSKEDRIKKLHEKAAGRNKDEFYFGMIRSRTERGVHIQDRGNEPMPVDVVKLLKTQDAGYVRTLVSTEEKLIERLRRDLGSTIGLQEDSATNGGDIDSEPEEDDDLGEGSSSKATILSLLGSSGVKGKKTVFVDSAKQVTRFNARKLSKGKERAAPQAEVSPEVEAERKAHLTALSEELSARLDRLALLQRTYREMQVQRSIMGKGSKTVVGGKKKGLSAEEERLNMDDLDELELKRLNSGMLGKKKLPEPEKGVKTGARVWKWKTERRR